MDAAAVIPTILAVIGLATPKHFPAMFSALSGVTNYFNVAEEFLSFFFFF
jgi:hypothetical protein